MMRTAAKKKDKDSKISGAKTPAKPPGKTPKGGKTPAKGKK